MITFNKKTLASLGIGLVFSAVAMYFTFVNIPLRDLIAYLGQINYWWIIPSILIAFLSYIIRVWRWEIILIPVKKAGVWGAFHPLGIGFMLNCILPGRVGEIARPAIYYKRENIEFSKALGSAGMERVMDAVCLLAFFIYILATISIDPSVDITFAGYHLTPSVLDTIWKTTLQISLVLVAFIVFISVPKTRGLINRFILSTPGALFFLGEHTRERITEGICRKATLILDNLSVGFDILKYPGYLLLCLVQSFVLWWLLGLSLYVLSLGCPGINITILQAFAVEIIVSFFITLPSVPGFWGLWEAGGVFGLMIFGVPAHEAAGMTLTYHFFHLVPVILVGLVSSMIIGVSISQTAHNGQEALQKIEEAEKADTGARPSTGCRS